VRRFLSAVAVVATALAGLVVVTTGPAGAATSITAPTGNPFVVPHDVAGNPQAFDISVAGFAATTNVFVEQCDGVAPTALNWNPTAHCDIVTSPAPVISSAGGAATFGAADPNHGFSPFKGPSPQGLFNCLSPNDPASTNGLPDYRSCQIRISTNNTAVTGDQVFKTLQLPEDPNTPPPPPLKLTMGNVSVMEGKSGTRAIAFVVAMNRPSLNPVSVDYKTLDGTAKSTTDYTTKSGNLVIPAGSVSVQVAVNVRGDSTVEPDEKFTLKIQHPTGGATIARVGATATILNDDPPKSGMRMAIGDAAVYEGDSGTRTIRFAVTLSEPPTQTVTAHYATVAGSATEGTDYNAASGTVTFAAGKTSATVAVKVKGDTTAEGNEVFKVSLSNASHAQISRVNGVGQIKNDD
jgi:hypothetical protein